MSLHILLAAVLTTGGPSSLQERGRDSCLLAVLCYKQLFTKGCMVCKRFFLKERKNVMFLNKIDLYLIALLYSSGRQSTTNKQTVSPVGYPRRASFSYPTYYAIGERVQGSLEEPSSKFGSRSSKK